MKYIIPILLLFTCALSKAQVNLVKNPSLEEYSPCPSGPDPRAGPALAGRDPDSLR